MLFAPVTWTWRICWGVFSCVGRQVNVVGLVGLKAFQYRKQLPPGDCAKQFVEEIRKEYQKCPDLYIGSYEQACQDAKSNLSYLLVFLHSPEHQDAHQFILYRNLIQGSD